MKARKFTRCQPGQRPQTSMAPFPQFFLTCVLSATSLSFLKRTGLYMLQVVSMLRASLTLWKSTQSGMGLFNLLEEMMVPPPQTEEVKVFS
ncbi:hypothetical protein PDJAM_G00232940 [Pangasius djambal]|uniref:Uncharacterized protein n=1 Tax=Pangasius djambal TaxID=1691987 RepID=A0ACC5YEU1_9TELE|nr:hypothetical protein [Pangasius djambal]